MLCFLEVLFRKFLPTQKKVSLNGILVLLEIMNFFPAFKDNISQNPHYFSAWPFPPTKLIKEYSGLKCSTYSRQTFAGIS